MVTFTRVNDGEVLPAAKVNELQSNLETAVQVADAPALIRTNVNDFPFRTGRSYGPLAHPRGVVNPIAITANMATTANRHVRYAPFYVPATISIDRVLLTVTTAATGALLRMCLYTAGVALTPNTLYHNYGSVSGTTIGDKTSTFGAVSIAGGAWYVAVIIGEATADGLQIAGRQSATGIFGTDSAGFPVSARENLSGITTLTAPSTWNHPTADLSTFVPRFELRVV
jgi:hypothetical protein